VHSIAARLSPRRPNAAEPLRLIAEFDDDTNGASALAESVGAATRTWGIWWIEARAARLAHAQATWLLTHDHPADTHLRVHAEYDRDGCVLMMIVGDPGRTLPESTVGDQWRLSVGEAVCVDAFLDEGGDRRMRCVMRARAAWRVRITWDLSRLDGTHPKYTFEDCSSEDDAHGTVARAVQRQAVADARWQGPHDGDDVWHPTTDGDWQ
jgi:hypothetical protein